MDAADLYLGQPRPGLIPELFAPSIVSTQSLEIEGVFAPGMREFYFVRQNEGEVPNTHVVRYEDGAWHGEVLEPRSGEISLSTDGNTMYLGNKYRERTESGWSTDISLGPEFEAIEIMRLTTSASGQFVFDEREQIGTIRYSQLAEGVRAAPEEFGAGINTGQWTGHPFIAPDESYLIWDSEREEGLGSSDLYISFRQQNGSWGPAINMGADINSEFDDAYGSVTPDGKYFFFHRINLSDESFSESEANIYWVDARVIENLRGN